MPLAAARLRAALTDKFQFDMKQGAKHEKYRLVVGGRFVAHTRLSRGSFDIDDSLVSVIANQLGVTRRQVYEMVECVLDRDGYLQSLDAHH